MFFYDGENFVLYNRTEATNQIPDDLKLREWNAKKEKYDELSMKAYLKTSDFMNVDYKPTIDYTKPRSFELKKKRTGIEMTDHFVNMARPLPFDDTQQVDLNKFKAELDMIVGHVSNVLCSGNKPLGEYVLNFFACTFGGRKLRKALYMQSAEGTGKGFLLNFFAAILGERMQDFFN